MANTDVAKRFDRVLEFTLKELYDCDGIDGFNNLIDDKAGEVDGVLSDINFTVVGTRGGLVQIRVTAEIFAF